MTTAFADHRLLKLARVDESKVVSMFQISNNRICSPKFYCSLNLVIKVSANMNMCHYLALSHMLMSRMCAMSLIVSIESVNSNLSAVETLLTIACDDCTGS